MDKGESYEVFLDSNSGNQIKAGVQCLIELLMYPRKEENYFSYPISDIFVLLFLLSVKILVFGFVPSLLASS